MSYQAVSWAMYDAPMLLTDAGKPDSSARQVLSVLAEHADERGANAHPSPTRIAYATGLDERTIERAQRRLERAGLIERDGKARNGCTRWRLNLALKRPASEYEEMQAATEKAKRVESERRQARRGRTDVDVSGTENAGQATPEPAPCIDCGESVRHGECGCPARRMPNVRHAAPPEPPVEPPMNHPTGGTLPPDPLRLQDPPSSDPGNGEQNSLYEGDQLAVVVGATTYVAREETHAGQAHDPRGDDHASADQGTGAVTIPRRPDATCPHGRSTRLRRDGAPRCPDCRSPPRPASRSRPAIPKETPVSNPPLQRDRCDYCQRDVVWGRLQSGHPRSFDAELRRLANVPPGDAYAYSLRYRAMVCLDGELRPPQRVLQAHRCREYAEAKLMANVDDMPDLYEAMARKWAGNA